MAHERTRRHETRQPRVTRRFGQPAVVDVACNGVDFASATRRPTTNIQRRTETERLRTFEFGTIVPRSVCYLVRRVLVELNLEDRSAIESILKAQSAAWASGDADAFGVSATDDVIFTNVVGMFSIGREPFVGQHAHIFSTIYKGSRMTQEIVAIKLIRPDVAIVDTLSSLIDAQERPPGIELIDGAIRTRLEQVMVKESTQWRVASFHNVAVHPAFAKALPLPQS